MGDNEGLAAFRWSCRPLVEKDPLWTSDPRHDCFRLHWLFFWDKSQRFAGTITMDLTRRSNVDASVFVCIPWQRIKWDKNRLLRLIKTKRGAKETRGIQSKGMEALLEQRGVKPTPIMRGRFIDEIWAKPQQYSDLIRQPNEPSTLIHVSTLGLILTLLKSLSSDYNCCFMAGSVFETFLCRVANLPFFVAIFHKYSDPSSD